MRLPVASKADSQEAGADVKGKWFIQIPATGGRGAHVLKPISWEDGRPLSHSPSPWEDGYSCLKSHFHISVQAEVFIRRERETEPRGQGRELKSPVCAEEHSPFSSGK